MMPNEDQQGRYTSGHSTCHNELMRVRQASVEAGFFVPHLREGMNLLDCGCGPGTITLGFAEIVNPGEVVGIDVSERDIERAKANTSNTGGASNITFQVGSVYDIPFEDNYFDAVFANGLLEHLAEPANAVREMKRVLKPGGVIGMRSPDQDGYLRYPPSPMSDKFLTLFTEATAQSGGNRRIGRRLKALLRHEGFTGLRTSASYHTHSDPDDLEWVTGLSTSNLEPNGSFHQRMLELGWVTAEEMKEMVAGMRKWAKDPDAFLARAWCEALGWKE